MGAGRPMSVEIAILSLVCLQTAAMLFVAHGFRAERRRRALTRLMAASWTLLDRLARDWMEVWNDPASDPGAGLERERREFNESLALALRHFRREDLSIAFAVKHMVGTVESDRLLYLAKQKPDAEPRMLEQVNIHFGPGTSPADLLATVQRFTEGVEEFQELGSGGYELRGLLAWAKGLGDKLPKLPSRTLGAGAASDRVDSIAPGSP